MRIVMAGIVFAAVTNCVLADDAELEFFEKKVRPILATHCYECHSSESKKLGGQLLLDSRDGVRKGGDSGAAIEAGQPDVSLLIKAVRYNDDSVKMPPKGKLPETVIADLEQWVRRGAFDPREKTTRSQPSQSWQDVMTARRDWWSLHPVREPSVPDVPGAHQSASPIDRFILAKLQERGLTPAVAADPRTLARRLSIVLTGLPPDVDTVDRFEAACRSGDSADPLPQTVVEQYVDSLLDSPQFGEQWARHWMDVVRFSETHGNEWNYEVHHAWRYRDYLIRAFNSDVRFDQLIYEHIAGDLLPNPRWNQREQFNESVIGTGFFRFGEVNHDDCITLRSLGYDLADNQIDTLTKAFLATTVACARCHNHKLDAVSSEDYYALLGVIRSTRNVSHCIDATDANLAEKSRMRDIKSALRQELAAHWRSEANLFSRYIVAAHAVRSNRPDAAELSTGLDPARLSKWVAVISSDKASFDEPFGVLRRISAAQALAASNAADAAAIEKAGVVVWEDLARQFVKEDRERTEFNLQQFETYADFRRYRSRDTQREIETAGAAGWASGGQSMTDDASFSGEFVIQPESDSLVQSILPAGRYTHILSSKLNGTLRSPVLPAGKKFISFQVIGQRSSAVRLVSNNCQLNYANYRALTSPEWQWVRFEIPEDRASLRTYAELMTMFDNPKFPDQLAPLGGDNTNYKMPWDKAAENPRSYFGITRVVLHDCPESPKPRISHLKQIFEPVTAQSGEQPQGMLADVADRFARRLTTAIMAWADDANGDDDIVWLDALVKSELVGNNIHQSARCEALIQEYREVEAQLALPRVCVGVADGGPGFNQPVFVRGDCNRPGDPVPRRFLEVLAKSKEPFASPGSGRLELAAQIAAPDNPLTARVIVNRIWHHLFGTGLVKTVDDFGHVGELPSHPELLDFLATKFVHDRWSIKRLIRDLVMTQAFQRSNRSSELAREVDPSNRLLQHYPARRMDAEQVRDAILFASGRLDKTMYGMSVQPYREQEYADRRLFPGPLDGNGRRSIYIKNNLMESPKFLGAFNFPGGKVAQGRRDVTNVPAQALALLNDPFVVQQADVWSKNLLQRSGDSIPTRLDAMFRSAIGRSPTANEEGRFEQTIQELADLYQTPEDQIVQSQAIWKDVAHSLFNLSEFLYVP